MNSFDVPYDENLFESNDFMKSYWERSTENKNVQFVQDVRTTEVDQELRNATMSAFGNDETEDDFNEDLDDEKLDDSVRLVDTTFNKKKGRKVLEPKSASSSTSIVWALVAFAALFLFIMNFRGSKLRE
jgi:hypothetical protein